MVNDIKISIINNAYEVKCVNVWDYLDDKTPFTIGSIRISSTVIEFFHINPNFTLDKEYNLIHYTSPNSSNEVLLFDFNKGWLAPLKYEVDFSKPLMMKILPQQSIYITIGTYNA